MSGVHFDISADNKNIVNTVNNTIVKMEQFEKIMKNLGQSFDISTPSAQLKALKTAISNSEDVIKNLNKQLDQLATEAQKAAMAGDVSKFDAFTQQMKKTAATIEEETKDLEAMKSAQAALKGQTDITNESQEKSSGIMVSLLGGQEKYNAIIRQLPAGLQGVVTGLNGMTGAAKAFIATPLGAVIGALVAVFMTLKTAINGSAENQQKFAKVSGYVSGIMTQLKEIVIQVGTALINAFEKAMPFIEGVASRVTGLLGTFKSLTTIIGKALKGDWEGIKQEWQALKASAEQIVTGEAGGQGAAIKEAAEETAKLYARQHQLAIDRAKWQEQEAELDKKIAKAQSAMYSGNEKERAAAAAEVASLNKQKYGKLIEFAKEEYAIKKRINELSTTSQEDLNEEYRLKAQITKLEAQQISSTRRADRVAASTGRTELRNEIAYQNELNALIQQNQDKRLALLEDGGEKQKAIIENNYQKAIEAARKQEETWKRQSTERGTGGVLTADQQSAIDDSRALAEKTRLNALQKLEEQYRLAYLKEYGSFQERKLAIATEYDRKIAAAGDENEKKSLENQKATALANLGKSYFSEFGTIDQKYESLLADWEAKLAQLPEDLQAGAAKVMEDSMTALVEQYIESGENADLSRWAATMATKSLNYLEKELTKITKEAASTGDLASDGFNESKAKISWLTKYIKKTRKEVNKNVDSWDDLMAVISDASKVFEDFGALIGGVAGDIISLSGAFLSAGVQIANGINKIAAAASALEKANAILAVISAAIKVISKVISINKANQEANEAAAQAAYDYARALEQVRIAAERARHANAFGTDDLKLLSTYTAQAEQSIKNINDVLSNSRAFNPSNIWEQRLFGITSDGRSGWQKFWGSNKNQKTLTEADYMTDGVFDGEKLRAWYDAYGKNLSKENKRIIEGLLADWDNYQDAIEESTRYISELLNDVADDVAESLVDSFIESGNALADLTDLSNDFAKSMAVAAVKSKLMSEVFTDEALQEISGLIENDSEGAIRKYNELLEQANGMSGAINAFLQGINLEELASMYQQNPQAGAFQTMSQDTATELNGRFTALQLAGEIIKDNSDIGVGMLASINALSASNNALLAEIHTFHMLETGYLEDISKHTKPLLEFGDKLDQIVTNTDRL